MKTGVIIAGGLGTRFRPITDTMPKALIDVDGRNLTEHVLLLLKRGGIETVYLAIGYLHEQIEEFFGDSYEGMKIKYIVEDRPLGTGGWMHKVDRSDFTEECLVVNGDDLSDVDIPSLLAFHKKNAALETISLHQVEDVTAFGVAEMDGDRIIRFVEKPRAEEAPSNWVSHGWYIFSPALFDMIPEDEKFMIEKDISPKAASIGKLFGFKHTGQWLTSNSPEQMKVLQKNWKHPGEAATKDPIS